MPMSRQLPSLDSTVVIPPDLVIRAGRVLCPKTGFDGPGAVAIQGARIVSVSPTFDRPARRILDFPRDLLLPGLIDLHAHPAKSGSMFGVEPDQHFLSRGTTAVVSQGDAGADTIDAYVRETIERSQMRILLAVNLSRRGESGPGGCFEDLAWADVEACVAAADRHRRRVWGIAVNASHTCCGRTDPREVLRRALEAATRAGLPLLYGLRRPEDWPLEEQLRQLRSGDVVTYCFRRTPHCIVANGRVIEAVRAARERGVLFDVGHGRASFDFVTAEAALRNGFPPDTISTDLQRRHSGQLPPHDLPLTMSKLRAAGMQEQEIFRAVTSIPAAVLGLDGEIGALRIGARADLVVLRWRDQPVPLVDVHENIRLGGRWETLATICGGRVVET
jgi:dihydroorotase